MLLLLPFALAAWEPQHPHRFKLSPTGMDMAAPEPIPHFTDPAGDAADGFSRRLSEALKDAKNVNHTEILSLAQDQYAPAIHVLGELHEIGVPPFERNLTEAFRLFKEASMHGYAESYSAVAFYLRHGIATEEDLLSSLAYETLAANQKSVRAILGTGIALAIGLDRPQSRRRAAETVFHLATGVWRATEHGKNTHHRISQLSLDLQLKPEESPRELEMLEESVERGDNPRGCVNLGVVYFEGGFGTERNYDRARELFERHREYPLARTLLAKMKALGVAGFEKNVTEAVEELEQLLDVDPNAATHLAAIEIDRGNITRACELFKRVPGTGNYPVMVLNGICPKEPSTTIFHMLTYAAMQHGSIFALLYMAQMLLNGPIFDEVMALDNLWAILQMGEWDDLSKIANNAYANGQYEIALQIWMELGYMGMTDAAMNAARVLMRWETLKQKEPPFGFDREKMLNEARRLLRIAKFRRVPVNIPMARCFVEEGDVFKAKKWISKNLTSKETTYMMARLLLDGDDEDSPVNLSSIVEDAIGIMSPEMILPSIDIWARLLTEITTKSYLILTGKITDQEFIDNVKLGWSVLSKWLFNIMLFPVLILFVTSLLITLLNCRVRRLCENMQCE